MKTSNSFKLMVIAGEASGDRIAERAIAAAHKLLQEQGSTLEAFGIGGDHCAKQGVKLYHHAKEMSVVGFVEVAKRFSFFKKVLKEMESLLKDPATRPDTLLLIDYPGFNIRLAKIAKKLGVRVVYYVSPQVWAWHKSRVFELKEIVEEMLVIFPFEEKIYRDAGLKTSYFVGHPLVELIEEEKQSFTSKEEFAKRYGLDAAKEWLLVFSGSRSDEVRRLLPVMSRSAKELAHAFNLQPILVEAPTIDSSYYAMYEDQELMRFRHPEATHELMYHAKAGILKSGTTTLEAALLGLPGVICYKTHPLTFAIGKRLVKLPYIGLANIVKGEKLYPELLQNECTEENIMSEMTKVIHSEKEFRLALENVSLALRSATSSPSTLAAEHILGLAKESVR